MNTYLFKSARLGFRNWKQEDIIPLAAINSDPVVMEFFPNLPSPNETQDFMLRMQKQLEQNGYCYFAVDILETKEFIGFIGLNEQTYLKESGPFVDIGWRLKRDQWNKGFATEGALTCLDFGFSTIGLSDIYSVTPKVNIKSENVMKKIGMKKIKVFDHPKMIGHPVLCSCVFYKISK